MVPGLQAPENVTQTAEVTAIAAVNEFFSRFGCPFQIFTDQRRNFESKLFRVVCELIKGSQGTHHSVSVVGQRPA